ncbi:hypothetical protein BC830DRAFT_963501, partial [Chytriomyces sp. MP71]
MQGQQISDFIREAIDQMTQLESQLSLFFPVARKLAVIASRVDVSLSSNLDDLVLDRNAPDENGINATSAFPDNLALREMPSPSLATPNLQTLRHMVNIPRARDAIVKDWIELNDENEMRNSARRGSRLHDVSYPSLVPSRESIPAMQDIMVAESRDELFLRSVETSKEGGFMVSTFARLGAAAGSRKSLGGYKKSFDFLMESSLAEEAKSRSEFSQMPSLSSIDGGAARRHSKEKPYGLQIHKYAGLRNSSDTPFNATIHVDRQSNSMVETFSRNAGKRRHSGIPGVLTSAHAEKSEAQDRPSTENLPNNERRSSFSPLRIVPGQLVESSSQFGTLKRKSLSSTASGKHSLSLSLSASTKGELETSNEYFEHVSRESLPSGRMNIEREPCLDSSIPRQSSTNGEQQIKGNSSIKLIGSNKGGQKATKLDFFDSGIVPDTSSKIQHNHSDENTSAQGGDPAAISRSVSVKIYGPSEDSLARRPAKSRTTSVSIKEEQAENDSEPPTMLPTIQDTVLSLVDIVANGNGTPDVVVTAPEEPQREPIQSKVLLASSNLLAPNSSSKFLHTGTSLHNN